MTTLEAILETMTNDSLDDRRMAAAWKFPANTTYLNHGSFGPPPNAIRERRRHWIDRLDDQPMNFYLRELEDALLTARKALAQFVDTDSGNLIFVENATYGMNVVASSLKLSSGDEILYNNHEYGAVGRIWKRYAEAHDCQLVETRLELPVKDRSSLIDQVISGITPRTRLLIVSHITSPTAIVMPVKEICDAARSRGVMVCIDGPHAIAQERLSLNDLDCDFYAASLHKWLSAPLGSGFLYVAPRHQSTIQPPLQSWGRLLPAIPSQWDEQFWWSGTRDPSAYLTVPEAISFLEEYGLERFRDTTHARARQARLALESLIQQSAIVPDARDFYGSMTEVPLPPGDWSGLQNWLWQKHGIEIPIIQFEDAWYVRVSCHLYTLDEHFERLLRALHQAFETPSKIAAYAS